MARRLQVEDVTIDHLSFARLPNGNISYDTLVYVTLDDNVQYALTLQDLIGNEGARFILTRINKYVRKGAEHFALRKTRERDGTINN